MKFLISFFQIPILLLFFTATALYADITVCPGNAVVKLDGALNSASDEEFDRIPGNTTYYYYFTPQVAGTIQVNSWVDGTKNSLFIQDGCGASLWDDTSDGRNKASPNINVAAGQQIVIALERRWGTRKEYWLGLTFTADAVSDSRLLCPGNTIVNLENTTTDATDWEGDPIPGDTTYYYHFTPQVAGTIQVDSWVDGRANSLFIKDGCGANLWRDTRNRDNKSSPKITVAAGQQIVVAIERRWNTQKDFRLDLTFEASDCPGNTIANLDNTNTSATDSDNGTITGNTTYYYHFTPQVPGTIQVDSWVRGNANSLFIKDGCGADLWSNTRNKRRKSSPKITVAAGQQIVVALERRLNTSRNYTIDFAFTVAPFSVQDDVALVPHNANKLIDVLANDTRTQSSTLRITTSPTHGTASVVDGKLLYSPTTGYAGVDTLVYEVKDLTGTLSATATVTVTVSNAVNENYRDFVLRKQLYLKGAMKTIGNTVLVPPTQTPADNAGYDLNGNICDTYTNGPFISDASETNDEYFLCEYQLDPNTNNSTAAELEMPEGATIAWVGLYWQAIVHEDDFTTNMNIKLGRSNDTYDDFNFTTLTPTVLDYMHDAGTDDLVSYAAFTDVTDLFKTNGWTAGHYVVADVLISEGKNDGLGLYGAWTLVVIYEDSLSTTEKFRSFSIFDGWKQIQADIHGGPSHLEIDVTGFYTPNKTNITSSVSVFTAEGDKNIEGDILSTIDYSNGNRVALPTGSNNSFNSSINSSGTRFPELINNNGIDIHTYNIGNYLIPKQSTMEFYFETSNTGNARDTYWPSMIAFETELVAPQLCYDYSYKQNGRYLSKENNNSKFPKITGYVTSDPIEASFYLRSTESDFPVRGISLFSDLNTSKIRYIPNTTYISTPNSRTYSTTPYAEDSGTCNYTGSDVGNRVCNHNGNVRVGLGKEANGYTQDASGILSSAEFMYTKFDLDPFAYSGEANISTNMKLNYYIIPPGGTIPIPYEYTLGLEVPRCPPSNSYTPKWGAFNVIDRGLNASRDGSSGYYNNLLTQVAQQPYDVDLVLYKVDPVSKIYNLKPDFNFNTTVLVDIINANAFGDINTSTCNDPGAAISQRIFVPSVTTPTVNKSPIPTLAPNFYASAAKNAAFRVWHFTEDNTSAIIGNWSATTVGNDHLTFQSLHNLYNSAKHSKCAASTDCGSDPSSQACFECMFNHYAVATCSRDNFSIRPEAVMITMNDNGTDYNNTANIPRNLSRQYGYETNASAAAQDPIDVAAGYYYRFNFNATNHFNITPTPNYTVYTKEINATFFWNPDNPGINANCNDILNTHLPLNLVQGKSGAIPYKFPNVGKYRLNVDDRMWTRVDFDPAYMTHHTTARDFLSGQDCDTVDAYRSQRLNGRVGCYISSEHNNTDSSFTQNGAIHLYQDHDIEAKPYRIHLGNIRPSIGMAKDDFDGAAHALYMSDLNQIWEANNSTDDYMAVAFIGTIEAVGADDLRLSNYVNGCYAQDLNISVLSSYAIAPADGANDTDADGTTYTDAEPANDLNLTRYIRIKDTNTSTLLWNSVPVADITTSQDDNLSKTIFFKNMKGQADIGYFINYNRQVQQPVGGPPFMSANNPVVKTFQDLNITCSDTRLGRCAISADLRVRDYNGTQNLNDTNVTFVYGRTYTPRVSTRTNVAFFDINYEIFCDACDTNTALLNLLNAALDTAVSPYASGWRTNRSHAIATDGTITDTITEDRVARHVTGAFNPAAFAQGKQPATATYDAQASYPYKTRMSYTPSSWLYFDKYNPLGNQSSFPVEFLGAPGQWVGQGVDKAGKTDSNASASSSRRLQW